MDASGTLAVAGISLTTMALVSFVMWLVYVIAYWKVFDKAGEAGWKSLIPFYNVYVLFKITWSPGAFWLYLLFCALGPALMVASGGNVEMGTMGVGPLSVIGSMCVFAAGLMYLMQAYKTSRAFGHGFIFFLGLLFFNFIFMIVLGYGSSTYQGADA